MSIWKERFKPDAAREMPLNPPAYHGKVWDWIFEKDSGGAYVRAGLVLLLVRQKALELRKRGVSGDVAQMATLDVWDRYSGQKAIKVPPRAR